MARSSAYMTNVRAVQLALAGNVPVVLVGSSGVGKSSVVRDLSHAMGFEHFYALFPSHIADPTDVTGLMRLSDSPPRTVYYPPAYLLPFLEPDADGVLFIDELNTGTRALSAILLALLLDGRVGPHQMGAGVRRVGAMNPPDIAAFGHTLAPSVRSRLCFINWAVTLDDVEAYTWARMSGAAASERVGGLLSVPDDWRKHLPEALGEVFAFIRSTGRLEDAELARGGDSGYPTPRTWVDYFAVLYALAMSIRDQIANRDYDALVATLVSGCVGEAVGGEFMYWRNALDLPDPADVLANPDIWQPDADRMDVAHAVVSAVVGLVSGNPTRAAYERAWRVLDKVSRVGLTAVAVPAAQQLVTLGDREGYPLPDEFDSIIPLMRDAGLL